jgi:hypothetical protein
MILCEYIELHMLIELGKKKKINQYISQGKINDKFQTIY